jgi:hypothetical protein
VLDLCTWVVEQRPGPEEYDLFAEEQGWRNTRSAIADLLDVALAKTPPIPLVHRDQVCRIITILAHDPDPTPALEATHADDRDPASLAINTIRGKALEAVVAYALWVRAQTPEPRDFTGMPEVRTVLDEHLQHDPSLAILSVYGRFFPWLVLLDHQWAADHVTAIFGDERGTAAWETYLTMCAAYDDTVALLPTYYERAVAVLRPDRAADSRRGKPNPDEHLGGFRAFSTLPCSRA